MHTYTKAYVVHFDVRYSMRVQMRYDARYPLKTNHVVMKGLWREFGKRCGFMEPKMMRMKLVGTVTENSHGAQIQKVVPSEVVVDKDDEMLVLVFDEALHVRDGVLEIKFNGVLSEHMKGFYQGIYVDGGATFKTVGNVTSELIALSNMHVSEETIDGDFKTA
nr:aminopeptidase M1-like isoform X1 [Tanacetum cinerariifolium]